MPSEAVGEEPDSSPGRACVPAIKYQDIDATFAVDMSWSTSSGVLVREKEVVVNLATRFSATARERVRVLPWNSEALSPITLSSIDGLSSSGGTDPTVLNSDIRHHHILRNSSLWFLLTDGEIDEFTVKRFALGIGERGLHGTACVIILFGQPPLRPASCNISVGQAVFAVVPDCAFLFHDIVTGETFVFQCKGCFRGLLPQEEMQIALDTKTTWHDLPQISYDKLAKLTVPKPRKVGTNTVLLESGCIVNLDELYSNRLNREVTAEILDNDDNLKSVLLAAQTRGRSREVEDWTSKQRMSRKDSEYLDRPDVDENAGDLVKRLVTAMKAPSHDPNQETPLRKMLRDAHLKNWTAFIDSISSAEVEIVQRNTVVVDALARVKLNRESPGSPMVMSPVSPRSSGYLSTSRSPFIPSAESFQPYQHRSQAPAPPVPSIAQLPYCAGSVESQISPSTVAYAPYELSAEYPPPNVSMAYAESYSLMNPYSIHVPALLQHPRSPFPGNPALSRLLYMKGYKLLSGPAAARPFCGQCGLCEDDDSPLALLLKAKPANCDTEGGFPTPNSHAEIKFPLALGNFSETDIISDFVCCEKCAYFIRCLGTSPADDHITSVIPLVPLSNEMNRDSTLKEINTALEERFHVTILDQTFLSILYKKLDEVTMENHPGSKLLISALRWECRNFMGQISLPAGLSASFNPTEDTIYTPLSSTMSAILPTIDTSGPSSLVHYPVDGFVTLLKGTLDLGLTLPSDDLVKKAVFQRLLFHLAEEQSNLREEIGVDAATEELRRVLVGEIGGLIEGRFCAEVEALEGTYLLESDVRDAFRRLKETFQHIERDCGIAIRLFLQLMMDLQWKDGPAEELFDLAKASYGDTLLFTAPWDLQEADCKKILNTSPSNG